MKHDEDLNAASLPLAELCVLADLPARTVRYYVQLGLVDRPEGETRAARYTGRHLEQLLLVKKWSVAGVSLERIRDLLHGEEAPVPARVRQVGMVEVCSHLMLAEGVEVVIAPARAGLSPEQVRAFFNGITAVLAQVTDPQAIKAQAATKHKQEKGNKK
jgi:DNA-binding transcriptional MerR regulator